MWNNRGILVNGTGNLLSDNVLTSNTQPFIAHPDNRLNILITELPYSITLPGTYRVAGRLHLTTPGTDGITIDADNVTLDLGGHALVGPGRTSGGSGIDVLAPHANLTVRNGTIRDWSVGISALGCASSLYSNLHVHLNGTIGMYVGTGCSVLDCTLSENSGEGVFAYGGSVLERNMAVGNGSTGIYAYDSVVRNNICQLNGSVGIFVGDGGIITGNTCTDNQTAGIYAMYGVTVAGNACHDNVRHGISVGANGCQVKDNTCHRNGSGTEFGAGIVVTENGNSVENNLVVNNDTGIKCNPSAGNYFASNRASRNTTDYDIIPGNTQGGGDLANVSF
jgi:parallel beta-helix repeat protein